MSTIKLPFGIFEHTLNHISVVLKEEGRQYVCPKCGGALIPRKGGERAHHFAHVDIRDCEGAAEYAIRAKLIELIEESKTLTLPISNGFIYGEEHVVVEEQTVQVDSVEAIDGSNPLQPRFVVYIRNAQGNEDTVTVAVNLGKKDVTEVNRTKAFVEIKLSELGGDISVERLRSVVNGGTKCIKWVQRPNAVKAENELRDKIYYDRIRTNPEHANELLESARSIPSNESHYNYPSYESGIHLPDPKVKVRTGPHDGISFTCEQCGRNDLNANDMQRYSPDKGTGVCSECVRGKR